MKPAIVWQLRYQAAFDRAMELQFGRHPNKQEIIDGFRQRLIEGIERSVFRTPFDPAAEHAVKYTMQRAPYQSRELSSQKRAPKEPVEEWLEVRYRFVDDGKTAEIFSVTSAKFPDI